ncbi:MAG: hypothetical protein ACI9WM_000875 [Arenicella sp.]|jgi:hypothetical protein
MNKILLITSALLMTIISQANTIIVDSINDSGLGSLRQASIDAVTGDTIRFNPNLIIGGNDTITLESEIGFSKALTIIGLYTTTDTLFISGNNNSRIFSINNTSNVTLDSLVLINGNGAGSTFPGKGGAVSFTSSDSIFIRNSTIKNNTSSAGDAGGAYGGGIYAYNAPIIVTNSTLSGNASIVGTAGGAYGGGIYTYNAPIIVTNSTLSGNTSSAGDAGGAYGGGIYTYNAPIIVTNSTLNGNTSSAGDAGLASGGGIHTNNGAITVINSTLSGNTISAGASGAAYGGGIATTAASSSVSITSSIFEGSSISNQNANTVTSGGYNIFSDAPTGATGTDDQTNATALQINLGPLQNNRGTTQTMLPGAGSIAINMGDPSDMTDAQNHTVYEGRRDVGAAETLCIVTGTHNETVCFGDSITVNGTVYNAINLTGTEVFTNVGTNNCDSTVTVTLTIENAIDVSTTTSGLTISANAIGVTYNWIDCNTSNSVVPAETGVSYTPTANGDYAVVVTVRNCSETSACVNISTLGIEEQMSNINLSIYPNPVINKLTIENKELEINSISILNTSGKVVKTITENNNMIDVSNLTNGMYLLQISTDNGLVSTKFIKE